MAACALALNSCYAPQPVIRIHPQEQNTTWERGKEFVSYRKGEYEVHCAYEGARGKYLVFDIEFINYKGEEFLVCPEKCTIYQDTGKWDGVTNQRVYSMFPVRAYDPEQELLQIDIAESQAEASRKNANTAAVAISVAALPLLVAAAASDVNSGNQVDDSRVNNTDLVAAGVDVALTTNEVNRVVQEDRIISLNDSRYMWQEAALRKTTLSPGYSIRGLVYFPIPDFKLYRKFRLDVPVGEDDRISMMYDVILIYPQL